MQKPPAFFWPERDSPPPTSPHSACTARRSAIVLKRASRCSSTIPRSSQSSRASTSLRTWRSRDVAAGGEGAPLVPAFHAECFTGDVPRVVLNIGGIANISVLPARSESPTILGGDTGPGNMLIDTWTQRITGALYDRDGRWAASGRVSTTLLDDLLSEPYFALPIPKSTGRELFLARLGSTPAFAAMRACRPKTSHERSSN